MLVVEAPSDLCVCDCVLPEDVFPPPLSSPPVTPCGAVLDLVSACLRTTFRWTLFSEAEVAMRSRHLPVNSQLLTWIHIFCNQNHGLPMEVQQHLTLQVHDLDAERLLPLVDMFGVNRDIDGLTVQVFHVTQGLRWAVDPAVVILWDAMFRGVGPLADYIAQQTKPIVHGTLPSQVAARTQRRVRGPFRGFIDRPVAPAANFNLVGPGAKRDDRIGIWLVLTPDEQWDPCNSIMHLRGSQAILFRH